MDFYSRQIRFLIAIEVRDGEVGAASQRRGRQVSRRSACGTRPVSHTGNQTQDQKGFASSRCRAEIFTGLKEHNLQLLVEWFGAAYTLMLRQNTTIGVKSVCRGLENVEGLAPARGRGRGRGGRRSRRSLRLSEMSFIDLRVKFDLFHDNSLRDVRP